MLSCFNTVRCYLLVVTFGDSSSRRNRIVYSA
uniref:Uncharacterized protein n=1 Tax=Podoviridae sp. ctZkC8 TaxID=2825259 RepID=A0A8S5UBR3_9CAUD|nr:MAG TPA: hypothetical protein [Caudoviricetes sp.]DAF91912.1 MAG TPA: hypothetical protein [Podoviridae sp. ctZkC8]DAJ27747.1 MAG TPA: hypothetical protein [Crassvirales sp.]DAV73995.1 MAG TPA: hypothetical protein [Bacteriophage sp.]DAJ78024.1 MAG TPA: hypothetical protein [Caudoviricetes sp.]